MKNKIFKNLSVEKKEKMLTHVLRKRTNGLLKVKEEVALISAGLQRKQFQVRTFNDISTFVKILDSIECLSCEMIYGDIALNEFRDKKTLAETGIAAMARVQMDGTRVVEQLLIYIPETRRCKGQCVREKYICEHVQSHTDSTLCCGLQLVQA